MQPRFPFKQSVIAFAIALVLYVVFYNWIEHRRTRQGPWLVTFTNQSGTPALVINEPQLNISNVTITFPGQPASFTNETIRFDPPRDVPFALPFGQCIFEDTTFQPGTIVISNIWHEIELLPRTLTLDKQEHPWRSGDVIVLTNASKSPSQ